MRAICCAILALVFYQMGHGLANSTHENSDFFGGISLCLCFASIVVTIGLCIAGL